MTVMVRQETRFERTCSGNVAAMATGTTIEQVIEFFDGDHRGPYPLDRIFQYMAEHGVVIGYHMNTITPVTDAGGRMTGYRVEARADQPAFVVVDPGGESLHSVYFDGSMVWDPHNEGPTDNLGDYKVVSWTPIFRPSKPDPGQAPVNREYNVTCHSTSTISVAPAVLPRMAIAQPPAALTTVIQVKNRAASHSEAEA